MNDEGPRLSTEAMARYRRDGYPVLDRPIFPAGEFAALAAHFEAKLATLPPGERPEAMDGPHFSDPTLFRWLTVWLALDPSRRENGCLHEGRLIHGSEANRGALRRCGYTMRYVSTRTLFDRQRHPWHQVYLARGTDHAGNDYGDPTRAYPDLVRERASALTGH